MLAEESEEVRELLTVTKGLWATYKSVREVLAELEVVPTRTDEQELRRCAFADAEGRVLRDLYTALCMIQQFSVNPIVRQEAAESAEAVLCSRAKWFAAACSVRSNN
jgi:predicted nuclease with TOPRIM domain